MKEKERYSLEEFDDIDWELAIVDNELGKSLTFEDIKNLLNRQDKENKKLCQQIIDLNKENNKLRKFRDDILRVQSEPYLIYKENQQLKHSQKQLAISELEKIEEILWDSQDIGNLIDNDKFLEKLNYLIKSLKGEK